MMDLTTRKSTEESRKQSKERARGLFIVGASLALLFGIAFLKGRA
jgi:hypothetical protein